MPALTQTMPDRTHEVNSSIEEQAWLESAEEEAVHRSCIGDTVDNDGNRLIVGGTPAQGAPNARNRGFFGALNNMLGLHVTLSSNVERVCVSTGLFVLVK